MSKDKVLKYCDQFSSNSIEHMENAIENKSIIEKGEYRFLNGCPSSYGLDDHVGLCETNPLPFDTRTNEEQNDQCEQCWKQALGVNKTE